MEDVLDGHTQVAASRVNVGIGSAAWLADTAARKRPSGSNVSGSIADPTR